MSNAIFMSTVGVSEARTHFCALLRRALAGETIVITKRGRPIAELRALQEVLPVKKRNRVPGIDRGRGLIGPDWDDPIPEFEEYF